MSRPKQHDLWPWFQQWAESAGVGLENDDDWLAWWECFIAGARAQDWHVNTQYPYTTHDEHS